MAIVTIVGLMVPVGIITALNDNPWIPLDQKQQAIHLALSDPQVKQMLGNKSYRISVLNGLPPNGNARPLGTDTGLLFLFKDGSQTIVYVNTFQLSISGVHYVPVRLLTGISKGSWA